jgi:hypothetical protein
MNFGWGDRGGVSSDARCSVPAAVTEESCGGRRNALPYVLFEERNAGGAVAAVHRGGARLPEVFHQVGAGGCSEGDKETVAFAIGQPLQLDSFLPASLARVTRASGLIQTLAEVRAAGASNALTVARFDQLATSALGGYECSLATTPEGVVRCVPSIQNGGPHYSDARCTQPIWQTWSDRISIQTESVEVLADKVGPVVLPRVDRVLTGGTRYEGPVYARYDTGCTVIPGVPNARQPYRRFSGEARLAELPALPIVVR